MDIWGKIGWSIFGVAFILATFEFGFQVGLVRGEKTLLADQAPSADYIANKVMNDYECQVELNGFTFEVCKQLGLITKGK